jgi:hypothetical protein
MTAHVIDSALFKDQFGTARVRQIANAEPNSVLRGDRDAGHTRTVSERDPSYLKPSSSIAMNMRDRRRICACNESTRAFERDIGHPPLCVGNRKPLIENIRRPCFVSASQPGALGPSEGATHALALGL